MEGTIFVIAIGCAVLIYATAVWINGQIKILNKKKLEFNELLSKTKQHAVSKLAGLSPVELDTYLEGLMAMIIHLVIATDISNERDTTRPEEIYGKSLVNFVNYLGENYSAIEYYYGKEYPTRWFNMRYKILELNGTLASWMRDPLYRSGNSAELDEAFKKAVLGALKQ